jgi:hypothetical protein
MVGPESYRQKIDKRRRPSVRKQRGKKLANGKVDPFLVTKEVRNKEESDMNIDALSVCFTNEMASTAFDESSLYDQLCSSIMHSDLQFDDTLM